MSANEAVPAATPDDGIKELEDLIARVRAAQRKFAAYSQEQVDAIFKAAALAANAQRIPLDDPQTMDIFRSPFPLGLPDDDPVIGKTGRGKTTIADLLLGLLQPDSGQILADGVNIAAAPDRWRKSIGYVPQHIVLLNSSIRENVAFGISPESIDDAKVLRALQRAQLLDFVNTLPEGLDFFVGDNGNRLSGGQRQRLGIARALYGEPRLLVLDEATSALDADTESAVVAALDELRGSLTMLVIAHRLSTIEQCDRILDLDSVL